MTCILCIWISVSVMCATYVADIVGPELSSNWFSDAVKVHLTLHHTEQVIQISKDVDGFMDEFEPALEHIEQIYWAGGESYHNG